MASGANINVDLVRERRSFTPGYRPGMNGSRPLLEGEPFVNFADRVRCVGTGDGAFVEMVNDTEALPLSVLSFGATTDGLSDNTDAFNSAALAASISGRTLFIPATQAGTKYRLGAVNWRKANIAFDEAVQLLNLDGSRYNGGYTSAPGSEGLIGLVNPGFYAAGHRIQSPLGNAIGFSRPGDREATFSVWGGHTGNPYLTLQSRRDAFLYGQTKETSGSILMDGKFVTLFNATNGPGLDIQCMATNGSPVLTMCNPSPTGTHTFMLDDGSLTEIPGQGTALPNIFTPCAILGPGIPANSFALSFNKTTITLGKSGTFDQPQAYTGPTGPITIRAVSGFSEFNFISWHMEPIGRTGQGGPSGQLKFYNDIFAPTNASDNPDDQEAYQNGLQIIAYKQVPGLLRDPRHNGSFPLVVLHVPTGGQKTYPAHASAAFTGYSGNPGLSGGQDPTAGPAAMVAVQIGGPCAGSYAAPTQRSFYKTGMTIEDYEVAAILISNPRAANNGTAIFVAEGAGNVDIRDNLVVGTAIIEPNGGTPAGPNAPGIKGQRTWDQNYEYRCVANNRWRRIPFNSDWP